MKTMDDYKKLGVLLGLEFVGSGAPHSVKDAAQWICRGCGRRRLRSYNKLRYDSNGCRCGGKMALTADRYHAAAQRLGIHWAGKNVPSTVLETTNWAGWDQRLFKASYHQLGYEMVNIPRVYHNFLPKRILDIIEQERADRLEAIRQRNEQL